MEQEDKKDMSTSAATDKAAAADKPQAPKTTAKKTSAKTTKARTARGVKADGTPKAKPGPKPGTRRKAANTDSAASSQPEGETKAPARRGRPKKQQDEAAGTEKKAVKTPRTKKAPAATSTPEATTTKVEAPKAVATPEAAPAKAETAPEPKQEQREPREQRPAFKNNRRDYNEDNGNFAAPETVGGGQDFAGNKRNKRRRNRNRKGGNEAQATQAQGNGAAVNIDQEELRERAWKVFLGEVTEEGLALMDDRIAGEAARRAFRVAELFLVESERRRVQIQQRNNAPETSADEAQADEQED